jgi:hypothetical protein
MSTNSSIDQNTLLAANIRTLVETMAKLGLVLQRDPIGPSEEGRGANILDFKYVCRLSESYANKLDTSPDAELIQVTTALLYVVASVSLVSCHPVAAFESWSVRSFSRKDGDSIANLYDQAGWYASEASRVLESLSWNGSEWTALSSATLSAVDLFRLQLSCLQKRQEQGELQGISLDHLGGIMKTLEAVSSASKLIDTTKRCIVTILVRLGRLFSLEGESLYAVQVSQWGIPASRGEGTRVHPWFEAEALSLLAPNSVMPFLTNANLEGDFQKNPADIEALACRLRLLVYASRNGTDLDRLRERFLGILNQIKCKSACDSSSLLLFIWCRTTVFLGLSECSVQLGDLELAVSLLKACFSQCKHIATKCGAGKDASIASEDSSIWEKVAMESLPVRCKERQVECLRQTALLYSRLGDHKKALEYAETALSTGTMTSSQFVRAGSTFSEMIRFSRMNPCQNSSEIQLRRLLLRMKASATPMDLVAKELSPRKEAVLSSTDFAKWREVVSSNLELEGIIDLLESESCGLCLAIFSLYLFLIFLFF